MCATCGCESDGHTIVHIHDHDSHHENNGHSHSHSLPIAIGTHQKTVVEVERDVLYQNNLLAERNRGYFEAKNILTLNLVSSPGSGKTTLLEKTLIHLKDQLDFFVVEGDQQTTHDADRIHATGTKVVQINTGKGCHLDAHMVLHALEGMKPTENSVLFIENVGNLVCPAMFDLGEKERVVIMSVTEGDDKPLKYPDMFYSSSLCIINKIDLLPYVSFDIEKTREYLHQVNHKLGIIEVSCTTGKGLEQWYDWLLFKRIHPITVL
ncbi:MAG: hydrogenase nickel incorporation protein HypB [Chitinophagales bacterium]